MANQIEARFDAGSINDVIDTGPQPIMVQMMAVELNNAITTARAYPRSIARCMQNILSLATLDTETAQECVYALPRGGKPITGPSVRLAEIIASQWGNCQIGSRVVAVDRAEKVVIAEGVFHDLETGMKRVAQVQRRISDKTGKLFNDDMIAVTGNAAASVAMREAVLKGVPKAIWRKAYEAAEHVIKGDVKTLTVRRADAIKSFAAFGIAPDQIFSCIEVAGLDDVGIEEIGILTAIYKAIRSGEATPEEYFPPSTIAAKATEAARGTARKAQSVVAAQPAVTEPPADVTDPTTGEVTPVTEPETEVDYGTNPKMRQFLADVADLGSAEKALDLWADDLAKLRDRDPDLHSAMRAAAETAAIASFDRGE